MPIGIDILESVHLKMAGMLCAASMANRCDFMIEGNGLCCVNPANRVALLSINDIGITKMPFVMQAAIWSASQMAAVFLARILKIVAMFCSTYRLNKPNSRV